MHLTYFALASKIKAVQSLKKQSKSGNKKGNRNTNQNEKSLSANYAQKIRIVILNEIR